MNPTQFKQVQDNAKTFAQANSLNNTTSPLTLTGLNTSRFPAFVNGYWLTIYNKAQYPDPGDDPLMEKVLVTAATIGASGSFTIVRGQLGTTAVAHPGLPAIELLLVSQHMIDLYSAVNTAQTAISSNTTAVAAETARAQNAETNLATIVAGKIFALGPSVAKSISFSAVANNRYWVDTTNGNVTAAVPGSGVLGQTIFIQKSDASANILYLSGNINGTASNSLPIRTQLQGKLLQWDGVSTWNVIGGDLSLSSLDLRYVLTSTLGIANGVATLDANAKIPVSQLPASVLGALQYQGTFSAAAGTYPISPGKGYYWVISVAGTLGGVAYKVGDWLTYDGTSWDKIDNSQNISTVNGQTGTVILTTTNIAEGTNLYFTNARAAAAAPVQSVNGNTGAVTNVAFLNLVTFSAVNTFSANLIAGSRIGIGLTNPGYLLHTYGGSGDGIMIQSTGDGPTLYLKGSAGVSSMAGSFNGNNIIFNPGGATAAGINNGAQVSISASSLGFDVSNASASQTLKESMQLTWTGKYWDGTNPQYTTFGIRPRMIDTTGKGALSLSAGGSELVTITNYGSVGINRIAPNSSYTLDVNGIINATSFIGSGATLTAIPESAITNLLTDLAARVQIGGDLGNTALSPQVTQTHLSAALPVAQGGTGTVTPFTTGSLVFALGSGIYGQNNANLFWDNTNIRFGVGTATPNAKVHIYANQPTLLIESSGDHPQLQLKGSSGYSIFQGSYSGNFVDLFVNSNGNSSYRFTDTSFQVFAQPATAGITTQNSPQYVLQGGYWNGTAQVTISGGMQYIVPDQTGAGRLAIQAAGEKMSVLSSGLVGIGTITPGERLELYGVDTTLRFRNGNDVAGGYIGNTANSVQLGMYNPSGSVKGILAAGEKRSLFGYDVNGKIGSLINDFGGASFRNVLDDGAGNASIAGNLSASIVDSGGQVYNVKATAYGAKGNTVKVTDAAIMAGQAVLTSPSNAFVGVVAGMTVTVQGAGAGLVNGTGSAPDQLHATVLSVTNSGSITLNINATVTVSGALCFVGTSDTTAIQAALNACANAGGGIVYMPKGRYLGGTGYEVLYIGSNTILQGAGWGASIIMIPLAFSGTVQGASATSIKNSYMRDFMLDGSSMFSNESGITYRNVTDCHVQNVWVYSVPYWTIVGSFEANCPVSASIYFENSIFDRGIFVQNPAQQDMTAWNNNNYVKLDNVEFRNNMNGFSTCLFYSTQNIVDIKDLRFTNCQNANTNLNVNGNIVTIRGLRSDGGSMSIYGNTLYMSDFTDQVGDQVINGVNYYVGSAMGQLDGGFIGTRQNNGGATSNGSNIHFYDNYTSLPLNGNYIPAVAAGATSITFNTIPLGYINGMKMQFDVGYSNYEVVTLLSGAGTATWTFSAPLTYAHAAFFQINGILPGDVTLLNARVGTVELIAQNFVSSCSLRVRDTIIATAGNTYGWVGMIENSSQTVPLTVNVEFDNVRIAGGMSFGFYTPTTNIITYKGFVQNSAVFGSNSAGWVPGGYITLAQNMQVRFENNYLYNGFGIVSSPAPTYLTGSFFKNNRSSQTLAPVALPTGVGVAPAVPTSGTTITNNAMIDAEVYMNGGMVTGVQIGSVITGINVTPSLFRLPAGQTVKLTYTTAPTWTWIGE